MKTKFSAVIAALLAAAACTAAPLMETTAIHSRPDAAAPAIGYLKAGTEPAATTEVAAPAGWIAVEMPGPHEAYVSNNDFSKSLDIRAGAAIRLKPKADAPVLATMQEGDKTEITGLRSGWTQIKLHKTIIGFIRAPGAAYTSTAAPSTAAPAPAASVPPPAPTAPAAPPVVAGPASELPRTVEGTLVETKRFLLVGHRPDYAYQLNDSTGKRIAYLDTSKIESLQKVETYIDRTVTVSGVIKPTDDWENLVIQVQTLEPR